MKRLLLTAAHKLLDIVEDDDMVFFVTSLLRRLSALMIALAAAFAIDSGELLAGVLLIMCSVLVLIWNALERRNHSE